MLVLLRGVAVELADLADTNAVPAPRVAAKEEIEPRKEETQPLTCGGDPGTGKAPAVKTEMKEEESDSFEGGESEDPSPDVDDEELESRLAAAPKDTRPGGPLSGWRGDEKN